MSSTPPPRGAFDGETWLGGLREGEWKDAGDGPSWDSVGRPVPAVGRPSRLPRWLLLGALACLAAGGVALWYTLGRLTPPPEEAPAPLPVTRKQIAPNVHFETQGARRRVVLKAQVCLRDGPLEGLLTRQGKKEHEYILSIDTDARQIHAALLAAGAEAGAPVRYDPVYRPATGSKIRVLVRYEEDGKQVTRPAQEWIRYSTTGRPLEHDWVFGGSVLVPDFEDEKKQVYLANLGDLICVSNMDTAMMDLPIESPKDDSLLFFEAWTERIPAPGTSVEVILEPVRKG